jgi:cobyrinic acid a,c-diamide synthase
VVIVTYARAYEKTSAAVVEGAYTTVSESVSVSFVVTAKILSDRKP